MFVRILDSVRTGAVGRCAIVMLAVAVTLTGFPLAGAPGGSISHVARQGERLFVLTASTPLLTSGVPEDDEWSTRFVVHRGAPLVPREFPIRDFGTGEGLEYVASTAGDPFPLAVSLAEGAVAWDEPATVELTSAGGFLSATYRVGADTASLRVPTDPDQPGVAEVTINGRRTEIRVEGSPAETFGDVEAAMSVSEDVGLALVDPEGFVRFVADFGAVSALVVGQSLEASSTEIGVTTSCTIDCLGCAGALLLYGGSLFLLIAACGGALVTGGSTALACIGSFFAVQGSGVVALAQCGACSTCS